MAGQAPPVRYRRWGAEGRVAASALARMLTRCGSVGTDHRGAAADAHRDHRTDPGTSTGRTKSGAIDRRLRPLLAPALPDPGTPAPRAPAARPGPAHAWQPLPGSRQPSRRLR